MAIGSVSGSPGDVLEFSVLTTKPRSDEALLLLKKIHSLVKPIMKKHGWALPQLCEFFPKNPNLLGINVGGGLKICIRLRPANDPNSFLPLEESLIGTMLHELTHNLFGPHDSAFFKQLGKLFEEYDALRATGYEGEGFLGKGVRVGLGVGHDKGITKDEARRIALKKFEERDKLSRLLGKGGKLGGSTPDLKGRRPADIAADAAERRLKETNSCGGGHSHSQSTDDPKQVKEEELSPEMQAELAKASRESKSFVIDLSMDSDNDREENSASGSGSASQSDNRSSKSSSGMKIEDDEMQMGKGKGKGKAPKIPRRSLTPDSDIEIIEVPSKRPPTSTSEFKPSSSSSRSAKRTILSRVPNPSSSTSASTSKHWECLACTFENTSLLAPACEICATERPRSPIQSRSKPSPPPFSTSRPDGWMCELCLTVTDHTFWTCMNCGKVKTSSAGY